MEGLLSDFAHILSDNIWLAFLMSLLAGLISSCSPCVLTSVPLIVGYVGGYAGDDKKRAFVYSSAFCLGMAATFTALGALSALLGRIMSVVGDWWFLILGLIMLLMALQILKIINIFNFDYSMHSPKKGLLGAFFLGVIGGILSSPCATPVLVVILAFVAGQEKILLGIGLLAAYAVGHCALLLVAGTSVAYVQKLINRSDSSRWRGVPNMILGILVLLLSFYFFYMGF